MFVNSGIDEQIVVVSYKRILFCNENDLLADIHTTWINLTDSKRHKEKG